MKRRAFTILSAGSLVFCLATLTLWVRSYGYLDAVAVQRWDQYVLESRAGALTMARISRTFGSRRSGTRPVAFSDRWTCVNPSYRISTVGRVRPPGARHGALGFGWSDTKLWGSIGSGSGWSDFHGATVTVPHACPVVITAIMPIVWLARRVRAWSHQKRQDRIRLGLCTVCAYDLRAHAPGQLCPECGMAIPASSPAIV